ncbi:MAG TPA: (d)CMP kinase [Chloroflexota bacterium]
MQIAIDGPAASGKSTVGRAIAERLGWRFLDTGLMYRAVAQKALERGIDVQDAQSLAAIARETAFHLVDSILMIDGAPSAPELRTPIVDAAVSPVSAHPSVRAELVRMQQELAGDRSIVMAGRDIGTTVLPDATLKLWLTASESERARRRSLEHDSRRAPHDSTTDIARLGARDQQDSTRPASPLRRAPDAIVIDTDGMAADEVVVHALELAARQLDLAG